MTTTDLRDQIRDELAGHPIGTGYYSTSVGVDEAGEMADSVLAVVSPLIAREKAEALRCAAWDWSDWDALESPEAWLRARADQIEQEADQ